MVQLQGYLHALSNSAIFSYLELMLPKFQGKIISLFDVECFRNGTRWRH